MSSLLEMKKITKSFNGNKVLDGIDFCVNRGQVHALIGENGAGKTTLMKILSGIYQPDSGEIYIDGKQVSINSPKRAQELGISMIYQEIRLFPDLNIMENIFIRREPIKKSKWVRFIDWGKAHDDTQKYLDYFELKLSPRTPVNALSIGEEKFVEIIKALSQDASIIIMDEPTSALTEDEVKTLFRVIADVKKLGVSIIYISHKLEEITKIADTVTIIRDGELIETSSAGELDINKIVKAMAGSELEDRYPKLKMKMGREVLRVEGLGFNGYIRNINFSLKKGEIFGITGLSGSGKQTVARVLFGINGPYEGQIYLNGKCFKYITPYIAKDNGLSYITGIGTGEGLINNEPVSQNITITNMKRISKMGFIRKFAEYKNARNLINRLEIGVSDKQNINNLSGGKQKKVIFAKWLFTNANVVIIDEPTAGIDIGSKVDIYNIINGLVLSGAAVMIISSDISEIMGMCDRIAVMFNGEIRKIFSREEASREKILYYSSGGK